MARLEGKKPDAGAIVIGAIIFALIAGGLFFAFRPVPEPTDAGLSNAVSATPEASGGNSSDSNAASGESANSLTMILTPLPLATPTMAPTVAAVEQTPGASATTGNSAPVPVAPPATAPVATKPAAPPAAASTNRARVAPATTPATISTPTPLAR